MNQNLQLIDDRGVPSPAMESVQPLPAAPPAPENPLIKLHQFLSGRYHWAILLGLFLAAIGGATAHLLVKDPYQSRGSIEIKPYLTRILYQTDMNGVMPMFDSYVDTQAAILGSQRIMLLAMQSPEWKAAVAKSRPIELEDFSGALDVSRARGSQIIRVTFKDQDQGLTQVAVKSIIEAYIRISGENDADSYTKRLQKLEERRTTLTNDLKSLNDRVLVIANEFGTDDLQRVYQPKLEEYNRLQTRLAEAELLVGMARADANAASAPAATATATAPAAPEPPLTPELAARRGDGEMGRLLSQRSERKATLDRLKLSYGDAHSSVRSAEGVLQVVEAMIAERMRMYEVTATQPEPSGLMEPTPASGLLSEASRKQAEFRAAELRERCDKAKAELLEIGRKELQIRNLKGDIDTVQKNLDDAKSAIDQLGVESAISGRTNVLSVGDSPTRAKRRNLPATGAGAFGGLFLGVGIIALIGAFDRRLKSVADAQRFIHGANRLLGLLPSLPEDLSDPAQAAAAAYCVHHVRTLLQLGNGRVAQPVIAVTSCSPGEGKTSLVLSLGHSYAATGTKTLLIDFDFIGAGLSARTSAVVHRKLRDILLREGLITSEQLAVAIASAHKTGKTLSDTLLELKLIKLEDLDRAQQAKRESRLGLLDVLDGEPLTACVMNGVTKNLSILPIGNIEARHSGQVSLQQVQQIIKEARKHYEVVLIDTGPVLGSLESCVVAAVADEVVLIVSRGQQRPLIDKTLARLADVGAHIAGMVFNRAGEDDVEHSAYSSYHASQRLSTRIEVRAATDSRDGQIRRLGPMAQAVLQKESAPPDNS